MLGSSRTIGRRTRPLPEGTYVFDAGPLSAFSRAGRLDVLAARYRGRSGWTVEVRAEIERGLPDHPALGSVLSADWLGEPVAMTDPGDLEVIEETRWALGGSEHDVRHLGEAATIVLADRMDGVAVLDDKDARRLASQRRVPIVGTLGILKACVEGGQMSAEGAWELLEEMKRNDFYAPPGLTREWFGES